VLRSAPREDFFPDRRWSEQFPNRDQHHGRIQQCRRQGRERCGNPNHVSFWGRASKGVIGHGLTSPVPVWPRAFALAVGVSAARACRSVLVRFLIGAAAGLKATRRGVAVLGELVGHAAAAAGAVVFDAYPRAGINFTPVAVAGISVLGMGNAVESSSCSCSGLSWEATTFGNS
jgi:hypothetical protein